MLSAASDCTCASCSDSQGMLCFEVGDGFDAHAGGGGCKHASLDGHCLLGWLGWAPCLLTAAAGQTVGGDAAHEHAPRRERRVEI